ncbi:MAG: 1-acyl-sn-glycerol-3-phosphate acyltransferase [bacterium JZ-2024 1]
MPLLFRISGVVMQREDLIRLKRIVTQRGIIISNHSTLLEPAVMFVLGWNAGGNFFFLTARDAFEELSPFLRFIIQSCGAYSVDRGAFDRESIRATVELLSLPHPAQIVIFPEGITYYQSDTLLNFMPGAVFMGFLALERQAKSASIPPLFLLPVAVKYQFVKDQRKKLHIGLQRLEHSLHLPAQRGYSSENLIHRLRNVGEAILTRIECEYNLSPEKHLNLNQRIQSAREWLLNKIEEKLEMKPLTGNVVDRYRKLLYPVNRLLYEDGAGLPPLSDEDKSFVIQGMRRLYNFLLIYEGYVQEYPTQERFLETLNRLEREVFGSFQTSVWKCAHIRIGEPIDFSSYFPEYQKNKTDTVLQLTRKMEDAISHLLASMKVHQTPL